MGTRSQIGIMNEDGSITTVYCHWDGYLSHNGKILLENYDTREKVLKLIEKGDMSVLAETAEDTHYYFKVDGNYYDVAPVTYEDIDSYLTAQAESWCEYFYLFNDGQWKYLTYPHRENWQDLTQEAVQV